MPSWIDSIVPVSDGELVNQAITNRSINAIVNNLLYLKSLMDGGIGAGQAILARDQALASTTSVSTPVWYNDATLRYEPAQAVAVSDPETSALVPGDQANCVGIVVTKTSSTRGDVLLAGRYAVDIAVAVGGAVTAGRYYLSATAAGFLTKTRPPITVSVLYADGNGNVYVLPQIRDFFLGDHTHYAFDLAALPAGQTSPPLAGQAHVISSSDTDAEGWLPANHAIFGGLAPVGAAFGYNVSADETLLAVWPPVPLSAYSIDIHKYNAVALKRYSSRALLNFFIGPIGSQGPQGRFSYGSQGTPGAQSPWVIGAQGPDASVDSYELAISVPEAQVGDIAFAEPEDQLPPDLLWDAYVRVPGYVNVRLGNLVDSTLAVPATYWDVGVLRAAPGITPVNPTELVTIDANGIWWMSNCYGDAPWPTLLDTTIVGPVVGPGECPRDPWAMEIKLSFAKLSFGTAQVLVNSLAPGSGSPIKVLNSSGANATAGDLLLGFALKQDLDAKIVRLTNVDEQNGAGFHYWRFPQGTTASLRGQVDVPANYVGTSPTVRLRLLLYGSAFGTFGPLTATYRRLSRPSAAGVAVTPPTSDTTLALVNNYAVANGQYTEALSDPITVLAGDVIVFNLARSISDGYAGDMGLVRVQGILEGQ